MSLLHVSLSWNGATWPLRHPLDYLGSDGGGGVGGGPGIAVGSALALKHIGSKRMPVAVCGDGDYLMGVTALWTAVHYRIPMLFVIANNISYNNDVEHQERMALMRDRPVENKWIGQFMNDPECDLIKMAEGQGAKAFGQCKTLADMEKAMAEAIAVVDAGRRRARRCPHRADQPRRCGPGQAAVGSLRRNAGSGRPRASAAVPIADVALWLFTGRT